MHLEISEIKTQFSLATFSHFTAFSSHNLLLGMCSMGCSCSWAGKKRMGSNSEKDTLLTGLGRC